MHSVIIGSGWNIPLFYTEVSTLLKQNVDDFQGVNTRFLQLQTPVELLKSLSSAATVDDIYSPGTFNYFSGENPVDEIRVNFENWLTEAHIENLGQSIAVRAIRIGGKKKGWSSAYLAGVLGGVLSKKSWIIDLDNPEVEIGLAINTNNSQIAWGVKQLSQAPRQGWSKRTPTQRPFFKPVSMDPRHAILMANLVKGEGEIIDPMTGTGGFLVEASFSGISAVGIDVAEEMVAGAKLNIQWAKENGATGKVEVIQGDSTKLSSFLPQKNFTGVVFDPPYGRNSQGTESLSVLFAKILSASREVVDVDSKLACLLPCTPSDPNQVHGRTWDEVEVDFISTGWEVLGKWVLPVHASLGRLLVLAKTKDLEYS